MAAIYRTVERLVYPRRVTLHLGERTPMMDSVAEYSLEDIEAFKRTVGVFSGGLTKQEIKEYYSGWAETYDKHLSPDRYDGPSIAAESCARYFDESERGDTAILDVAAGTGRVGVELHHKGFLNIHALDPSEAMLEIAKTKNIYRKFICAFLTADKLPINDDAYGCVTSSGGFGYGHIPCDALHEMIRITKPGGYIITAMREEYLESPEYKDKLENLMHSIEMQGKWKMVERSVVPNFAFNKTGVLFVYKIL